MHKYLQRLCNEILSGKFKDIKYAQKKTYRGIEIETQSLFNANNKGGFIANVYSDDIHEIKYLYDYNTLLINEKPYQYAINLLYLEDNSINITSDDAIYDNYPYSVELECYTNAGGDMIICLKEPTREKLQEYIDNFDINAEVMLYWSSGKPTNGVPFNNIKEHYEDYEYYLKWLQTICDKMPY